MTEQKPVRNRRLLHDALKPEKMTPEQQKRWEKLQRVEDIDFSSPTLEITPLVKRVANDSWWKDNIHEEVYAYMASKKSYYVQNGWPRSEAKRQCWLAAIHEFGVKPEHFNGWRYGQRQTFIRNKVGRIMDLIAESVAIGGLHPAMNWALANLHKIGLRSDEKTWLVSPSEAPSAEAWNYLMLAIRAPAEFSSIINKELVTIQREERALELENERKDAQMERERKGREQRQKEQEQQAKMKNRLAKALEKKKADEALRVKQEAFELKKKEHEMAVELQREIARAKEAEKQAIEAKVQAEKTSKITDNEQFAKLKEMEREIDRKLRELERQQQKAAKEKEELREMKRKEREAKQAAKRKEEMERRLEQEMLAKQRELEKQQQAEHEKAMEEERKYREQIKQQVAEKQIEPMLGLPDLQEEEPETPPDFDAIIGRKPE